MGDIVGSKDFKTAGDWVNQMMAQFGSRMKTVKRGDEEAQEPDGIDTEALVKMARANGFEPKIHEGANPGLYRMTIGNALRARARRRHGMNDPSGEWHNAPGDFCTGHDKTENPDGTKVAKEPPANEDGKQGAAD